MSRLHELQETRGKKIDEMGRIIAAAEAGGGVFSDEAGTKFEALKTEIRGLDAQIGRYEAFAELERRAPAETVNGQVLPREVRSRYSIAKAIQEAANGRLTGLELETHQELSRGRTEVRGVMAPTEIFFERRNQSVGQDPRGGYLVQTEMQPLADRFRPAMKVEALGATVLRNLTGNVELPNIDQSGQAYWIGENAGPTRSVVAFGKVAMSPKTVSAEYKVTRRLMIQSAQSIEDILRRDLGFLLTQEMDRCAINGTGVGQPEGVLQAAGLEKVATAARLEDTASDLIAAIELDDVTGSRAFLTNPQVMNAARKVKDGQNNLIGVSKIFHDERVEVTTQVPSNIGSASNKSGLIFGNWSELTIGYWSGVDILPNPFHGDVASSGGVLIHAFLDVDAIVRRVKAFAYAEI